MSDKDGGSGGEFERACDCDGRGSGDGGIEGTGHPAHA